ncbi:MAG: SIS domain-containing protein [Bacteroidota bacterium]
MDYLGIDIADLKEKGGFHTAKEIVSQPEMWLKTYERVRKEKEQLLQFLGKALEKENTSVILTGAGTSAFIGEALSGYYQRYLKVYTRSIATTDIITHPEDYFIRSKPTLLISFARSGDSPESLATVELAHSHCDRLHQLIITCNKDGILARKCRNENTYVFLLPEETNDVSLAMTSSFSSMLLAGLMMLHLRNIEALLPVIENICNCGNYCIRDNLAKLKSIAALDFKRAVFLGSGPLFGIAHESHLKVQELSDGKIVGKYDSFLGFRHGPRAVVDDSTLVTYLMSFNGQVKQYEIDLIHSISESPDKAINVCVGYDMDKQGLKVDFIVDFPPCISDVPKEFFSVFYILPAQIIGFFKSLEFGLEPDSPSKGGSISRVVQGVKIY